MKWSSKKGIDNLDADCLSRVLVVQTEYSGDLGINSEVNCVCMASVKEISTEWLNAEAIRKATHLDEQLSKTKLEILDNPELSYEYTQEAGILFKGHWDIIPKIRQKPVSDELHRTHIGITKMKQLACRYIYWKGVDKDIEQPSNLPIMRCGKDESCEGTNTSVG
jgi:hypothetical protein